LKIKYPNESELYKLSFTNRTKLRQNLKFILSNIFIEDLKNVVNFCQYAKDSSYNECSYILWEQLDDIYYEISDKNIILRDISIDNIERLIDEIYTIYHMETTEKFNFRKNLIEHCPVSTFLEYLVEFGKFFTLSSIALLFIFIYNNPIPTPITNFYIRLFLEDNTRSTFYLLLLLAIPYLLFTVYSLFINIAITCSLLITTCYLIFAPIFITYNLLSTPIIIIDYIVKKCIKKLSTLFGSRNNSIPIDSTLQSLENTYH
jgi:hypothetical protein